MYNATSNFPDKIDDLVFVSNISYSKRLDDEGNDIEQKHANLLAQEKYSEAANYLNSIEGITPWVADLFNLIVNRTKTLQEYLKKIGRRKLFYLDDERPTFVNFLKSEESEFTFVKIKEEMECVCEYEHSLLKYMKFSGKIMSIVNIDGTTVQESVYFDASMDTHLDNNTYILSGCPLGGSKDTYCLYLVETDSDGNEINRYEDYGCGVCFTVTDTTHIYHAYFIIHVSCENLLVYPMISIGGGNYIPYGDTNPPENIIWVANKEVVEDDKLGIVYNNAELELYDSQSQEWKEFNLKTSADCVTMSDGLTMQDVFADVKGIADSYDVEEEGYATTTKFTNELFNRDELNVKFDPHDNYIKVAYGDDFIPVEHVNYKILSVIDTHYNISDNKYRYTIDCGTFDMPNGKTPFNYVYIDFNINDNNMFLNTFNYISVGLWGRTPTNTQTSTILSDDIINLQILRNGIYIPVKDLSYLANGEDYSDCKFYINIVGDYKPSKDSYGFDDNIGFYNNIISSINVNNAIVIKGDF